MIKMWWSFPVLLLLTPLASCEDLVTTLAPSGTEIDIQDPNTDSGTPTVENSKVQPTIRSLRITSDIKYRYATTLVSTRVVNPSNQSGEAVFTVTLPESAFISEFLMEVKGKAYKAYVKEKEEAKAVYQQAVEAGQFAGHVALDARDSNQFTVSVNVEALGKVTFNLTYEQLLTRNLGVYSNIININPQQIVDDMSVIVNIEEPTAIVGLEVPELQLSNEAIPDKQNKFARIEEKSPNHTQVIWEPTPEQQKSQNSSGLNGQFIVKYDVNREENPQQILVDEGYFVHFFAPDKLPKLKKHVVFVLDFSGSMGGRKLEQLKDAMKQIFSDLNSKDFFSIVVFQSWVEAWSPSKMYATSLENIGQWERERYPHLNNNHTLDNKFVVEASPENIRLARSFMENYTDLGSTNIMGGLRTGLKLVDIGEEQWINESNPPQPIIVFLTDGQPNVEEYDTDVIINKTKALNTKQCPIFSLAFGYGADFNFLRKLSLQNFGFARNIYEAADATQQLKNFYQTIASPMLSNVTFNYLPGQVDNSSNTKKEFPVFFYGSEIVVAGKVNKDNLADKNPIGELRGITADGPQTYPIIIDIIMKPQNRTVGHLEKAWAYLTIQQLLDKADSLDKGEEKNQTRKKALDLALQYSFVTPLTSLVVVKPNETESAVDATKVKPGTDPYGSPLFSQLGSMPGVGFSANRMPAPLPASGFGGYAPMMQSAYPVPMLAEDTLPLSYEDGGSMSSTMISSVPTTTILPLNKISLYEVTWLRSSLNATEAKNITITVEGNDYKLGINETDTAFGDCQINNQSGECHHVQYCALDIFQRDISQFLPYKCYIPGDYLGVCCPKNLV